MMSASKILQWKVLNSYEILLQENLRRISGRKEK